MLLDGSAEAQEKAANILLWDVSSDKVTTTKVNVLTNAILNLGHKWYKQKKLEWQ